MEKRELGVFGWAEKLSGKREIWFGWNAKDEVEKEKVDSTGKRKK